MAEEIQHNGEQVRYACNRDRPIRPWPRNTTVETVGVKGGGRRTDTVKGLGWFALGALVALCLI